MKKIYVAGHNGMVGSACLRELKKKGYDLVYKNSQDLDLRDFNSTFNFIKHEKPDAIVHAAAKVGGILANDSYPYEFLMDNMLIQNNLIKSSFELNIKKFIFLGSSCIYPKLCKQPIKEEYLLTDSLESTNQWYALAKISGVKLIEALKKQYGLNYVALMPTNLYGPNDNFDLKTSHVFAAMIRKFHDAKVSNSKVILWGTGSPMREFLFVEDLAKAVVFSLENNLDHHLYNVGSQIDISIKDLSILIQDIIGFDGIIDWDKSKPDGTPRKIMDSSRIFNLGWKPEVSLKDGIKLTYDWFISNQNNYKKLSF